MTYNVFGGTLNPVQPNPSSGSSGRGYHHVTFKKFWQIIDSSYNGRLIGNHVWPIEWHDCQ